MSLLFTASTTVAQKTVGHPETIKSWLAKSSIYDRTVDTIIDNAPKEEGGLPLNHPDLRKIANKVFSPQVLQNGFESIIDGTYHWMQGKVDKPDFRLDLTAVIESFKTETTNYLRQRLNSLPNCPGRQVPDDTNPFAMACKPRGLDVEKELQKFNSELSKQEQLSKPIITVDNLQEPGKPAFFESKDAMQLMDTYKFISWAPFFFGTLSALLAVALWFLSADKRHALKTLGRIFAVTAVLIVVNIILQKATSGFVLSKMNVVQDAGSKAAQELAAPIIKLAINDVVRWNAWFVGIYAAIAAGIGGYLLKTRAPKTPGAKIKS